MGNHSDGTKAQGSAVVTSSEESEEQFRNPGLPPHRPRLTDVDPKRAKGAERQVILLFVLSMLGSLLFWVAYFGISAEGNFYDVNNTEPTSKLQLQNLLLGLGIAFAMFGIGIGVVHWARTLMPDHELVEERHDLRPEEDRAEATEIVETIVDESGIKRRPLLRNTLIGSVILAPLTFVTFFRDLGPADPSVLKRTMWDKGVRLVRDPSGTPIKAADVTIGSAYHVLPETLSSLSHENGYLEEKAKAVVLLMRLDPQVKTGMWMVSSPTPRCAPMWVALSPCTSSALTTCCARATSQLLMQRMNARSFSALQAMRFLSFPLLLTATATLSPKVTSTSRLVPRTGNVAHKLSRCAPNVRRRDRSNVCYSDRLRI